ncbi:hypothetical protein LMH73_008745 [Vibrio splendidus]|nr:hypothetical protein [Vibrio splendidus]MCC4879445.1 hypothetical protein [Vibrio splendidus]
MSKLSSFDKGSCQLYTQEATDRIVIAIKGIRDEEQWLKDRKQKARYQRVIRSEPKWFYCVGFIVAFWLVVTTMDHSQHDWGMLEYLLLIVFSGAVVSIPPYLIRWSFVIPRAKYRGNMNDLSWKDVMPFNISSMLKDGNFPQYLKRHVDSDTYEQKIKEHRRDLDIWLDTGSVFQYSLLSRYKGLNNRSVYNIYVKLLREQLSIQADEEKQSKLSEFDKAAHDFITDDTIDGNWSEISNHNHSISI